ncbi:MAG: hypothetical protein KGM99_06020 [Burkholderiales bacterium]|nr:hypothetical protein [Burkholderiales bacterium]
MSYRGLTFNVVAENHPIRVAATVQATALSSLTPCPDNDLFDLIQTTSIVAH